MIRGHDRRLVLVWLGLAVATVVSVAAGASHAGGSVRLGPAVALAIGFVKVRFVGLDFMELRNAPPALRWLFEAWVVAMATALLGVYAFA